MRAEHDDDGRVDCRTRRDDRAQKKGCGPAAQELLRHAEPVRAAGREQHASQAARSARCRSFHLRTILNHVTTVRIGIARPDEAAAIATMSRRLIEDGLPPSWTEPRILRAMRNRECVVIAARDRRRTVGFAIMDFYDEHAHLGLLAVQPGHQKQGVGRQLLEWLEASARTAGIFHVLLELRATNDAARAFYEKLGYRECGRRIAYYNGREDALRMSRNLTVSPTSSA